MSTQHTSHIEPSEHSTDRVDEKLRGVEKKIDAEPGAGSPAIKPNKDFRPDGKPVTDTPENPRLRGAGAAVRRASGRHRPHHIRFARAAGLEPTRRNRSSAVAAD
jgi:hypothetical protein